MRRALCAIASLSFSALPALADTATQAGLLSVQQSIYYMGFLFLGVAVCVLGMLMRRRVIVGFGGMSLCITGTFGAMTISSGTSGNPAFNLLHLVIIGLGMAFLWFAAANESVFDDRPA